MIPDRWKRLSEIYAAAVAHEPAARTAFLDGACVGDPALRAELESLLHHDLPSTPAVDVFAAQLAAAPHLAAGTRLGSCRVEGLIGEGGMGRVYRAHDDQLGRDVAIKVLPPIFAVDPERRARFDREARVLASLNHSHIGAIYGVVEGDGVRGLVLELVEGETLADRIRSRGSGHGLAVSDALAIARQVAEALDAAHEKGVVHRDLKPANITITSEGHVKVLDFGLAKVTAEQESAGPEHSRAIGLESRAGMVLGTAAYMSPEQRQGRTVDKRTDIWAFGCVLYEMLTGRSAFASETAFETTGTSSGGQPDWARLPLIPPRIAELLRRCLEADPKRRLRDIGEAVIAMDTAVAGFEPSIPSGSGEHAWRGFAWTAAFIAALASGLAVWVLKPAGTLVRPAIARVAIPVAPGAQPARFTGLALSPNGRTLAYVADLAGVRRLCVRAIDSYDTTLLSGTDGASSPFFSPDGEWVGFVASNALKKVPVKGGTVETILDLLGVAGISGTGAGATWSSDDTIFFGADTGIWKVPAAGGLPERVTVVDRDLGEVSHQKPLLLPDGKTLLYTAWFGPGWDEREIVAQRLGSKERQVLAKGAGNARVAPTGHLLYTRAGSLMAVRFDAARLQVSGTPVSLLDDLREGTPAADFDIAADGSLAYVGQSPGARNRLPVLVDRQGRAEPMRALPPDYYQSPRFSPDGRLVAFMVLGGTNDIVVYDVDRGTLARLTTEGSSQNPVWRPDGERIVYRGTRRGSRNLFWKALDGTAAEERLTTSEQTQTPWSFSPDGTTLAFGEVQAGTGSDIWLLDLGDRRTRPLIRETYNETAPRFSPTGRWLAFVATRSGQPDVFVQSYPDGGKRWQVSANGGSDPVWARNGRELFYRIGRNIMSVEIGTGPVFTASTPKLVFEGDYIAGEPLVDFDVHPDGRRFLMIRSAQPDPPVTHVNVVLNWFDELERVLPGPR